MTDRHRNSSMPYARLRHGIKKPRIAQVSDLRNQPPKHHAPSAPSFTGRKNRVKSRQDIRSAREEMGLSDLHNIGKDADKTQGAVAARANPNGSPASVGGFHTRPDS